MADELRIQELQRESRERYQALESGYQQAIGRLERSYQDQLAVYQSELRRMTREQQAKQEQRIRAEIAVLQKEMNNRIQQLEMERERKLEELQQRYQQELNRLMRRFQSQEDAEKRYAESQLRLAEEAYERMSADPVVRKFLPQAAQRAKERLDSAKRPFEDRLYATAAARWFTVKNTCESDRQKAERIRSRWESRRSVAEKSLIRLEESVKVRLDSPLSCQHVIASARETPSAWVERTQGMTRLRELLVRARNAFEQAPPGDTEPFDQMELSAFGAEGEAEALEQAARREIRNFLCCVEMQHLFYQAAGEGWEITEGGSVERFRNYGQMTLSNGLNDRLRVELFPKKDDRNVFVLIALYTGHRANSVLRRRLLEIIGSFDEAVRDPMCCGMQIIASSEYTEDGCPGIRLELRLITAKEEQA